MGSGLDKVTATVTTDGDIRLLGGASTLDVMNSVVDELTDAGIDVDETLTLVRHTGDPEDEDVTQFKLLITENTVRSFEDARINLEFSGIPDDVEVEIDAWVTTLENLEDDGPVDQALNQALPLVDTSKIPIRRMINSRSTL